MGKRADKAFHKFQKIAKLNAMQDAGGDEAIAARKAKRVMADTWVKRRSKSTVGTFKRSNAKPGDCSVTKGGVPCR